MSTRPVPRHIDMPNRLAEFLATFLVLYYGCMFLIHNPLVSFGLGAGGVYLVYRLTLDKPEGQMYRLWYKYLQIGKMIPSPAKVKKFEI